MDLAQRDEQLTELCEGFLGCEQQQRGGVVLITGAVGSGKTTLLEAFSHQVAAAGGGALTASGSPAERDLNLGIVSQLLHSARLRPGTVADVLSLIPDTSVATPLPGPAVDAPHTGQVGDPRWVPLLHGLFAALVDLADTGPLVLAVDDVHQADLASLHCLLYVARRLRQAKIMIVLTEAYTLRPPHPHFRAELFSQPYFSRITLAPLTIEAIERMVDRDGKGADARPIAEHCLRMTGGNPMLTRALIEEGSTRAAVGVAGTASEDAFEQAVLGSVYRHEPGVRKVAQALAVLNRPTSVALLGQLLDLPADSVVPALRVLNTSGLLDADQLRHPRVLGSILADMTAEDRRALHRRVAEVLHDHGTDPSRVAEHLVAADWADAAWVVPVLQDAARHALAAGGPDVAASCLRLIGRAQGNQLQRAAINAMLVTARWQVNPLTANGHLADLVQAARADGWSTRSALCTVPYLLWQGRVEEATAAVSASSTSDNENATAGSLRTMQLLVSLSHPDQLPGIREAPSACSRATAAPTTVEPQLQAVTMLAAALSPSAGGGTAADAEQFINRHYADHHARGPLAAALLALLYASRADRVATWSDLLLAEPAVHHAPIWQAILHALGAEAALRLGDLPVADQHAQAALRDIPPQAWGVVIGGPLATLIHSATEAERLNEADRWLTVPLSAGALRTPLGLHYVAARARHHLAMGRPQAATSDLRRCGELMQSWRVDVAGLVPWRLELGRVELSVGNKTHAVQLLEEQLRVPQGVDDRTRGRVLRLLAGTGTAEQGRKLLSEAVRLLHASGDRLELVRALGDTSQALQRSGDYGRARVVVRRAHQLAQDCGAGALAQRLLQCEPGSGMPAHQDSRDPQEKPSDGLSEAERRVAALAAGGCTNRQISSKLFITVSTVEQHLTRIYRKLDVKRRTDLPALLIAHGELRADMASGEAS